jgi:hypothetical protein
MCTDCKFCIHSSKVCDVRQLVDEIIYVEKGIKNIKNFYLSFERKIKVEKVIKDNSEVLIEMDYLRKQFTNIFEEYDALKDPKIDELLEIEAKLFEFRNSIQRGYTYNLIVKNKYQNDLKVRKLHIQQLKQQEELEEDKDIDKDPEKLLIKKQQLQKDNQRYIFYSFWVSLRWE